MDNLQERFLRYVKIDTQSDEYSSLTPSTNKQFDLAKILVKELEELGLKDIELCDNGIIYAKLLANTNKKVDKIGLIAHMDTSPDFSGKDVKPRIIKNYDGQPIVLNEELNIILDPKDFDSLKRDVGSDLIVTDGTTLLGADDKAGIAIIMTLLEYLNSHPNIEHGEINIAFTPDEEVGRGTENFDINKFKVDYAYTIDGGYHDEIEYENFNASSATVTINGLSIHPGEAKNKMLNSQLIAFEFNSLLPVFDNPMYTEKYEGFNHLLEIHGDCEKTTMHYIIRNHDKDLLTKQENDFMNARDFINRKYKENTCEVEIAKSYSNMKEYIEQRIEIIDQVKEVMKDLGLNPKCPAIRGGTDGASLTYMGILCPNLGTGGRNYHGKYEYVSINEMHSMVQILINLVQKIANK